MTYYHFNYVLRSHIHFYRKTTKVTHLDFTADASPSQRHRCWVTQTWKTYLKHKIYNRTMCNLVVHIQKWNLEYIITSWKNNCFCGKLQTKVVLAAIAKSRINLHAICYIYVNEKIYAPQLYFVCFYLRCNHLQLIHFKKRLLTTTVPQGRLW